MITKLILTYTYNRKLGAIIQPAIATKEYKSEFYQTTPIFPETPIDQIPDYSEEVEGLLKITYLYTEKAIFQKFGKTKQTQIDFYQNLKDKNFKAHIRKFIDKTIIQVIQKAKEQNIPIYHKQSQNVFEADQLTITDEPLNCNMHFTYNGSSLKYNLRISYAGKSVNLENEHVYILCEEPAAFILNKKIYFIDDFNTKKIIPFISKPTIEIPERLVDNYLNTFVHTVIKSHNVTAEGITITEPQVEKTVILRMEQFISELFLSLNFQYNNISVRPDQSANKKLVEFDKNNKSFTKITRDNLWEHEKTNLLKELGLIRYSGSNYTCKKGNNNFELVRWINKNHSTLKSNGFRIINNTDENYLLDTISLSFKTTDKNDWFDLYGTVKLGKFEIPFVKLRKHILTNNPKYELPDNTIAIIPQEWFAEYKELFGLAQKEGDSLRLHKYQFEALSKFANAIDNTTLDRLQKIYNQPKVYSIPQELKATLRSYQAEGYNWMRKLNEHHFGGCLADDMGLGKTIQTLTLLIHQQLHKRTHSKQKTVEKQSQQLELFTNQLSHLEKNSTTLIIAPSSLVHNWKNETQKFAPNLKLEVHTGITRTKNISNFKYVDLVLTSYGIIRNDIEQLKQFKFDYVVIDESQHIKNPDSVIYKAVKQLNSCHKLVLTGTPIENSLSDLWAQLNFINPGLVGSRKWFNDYYAIPIEKDQDQKKLDKLRKITAPFILRRTKQEVAKDLPELTEQTILCEMSEEQEKLYETTKSAARNALMEIIQNGEANKNATLVLKALNELRQLANNPTMLDPNYNGGSGKTDIVERHIENLIAENHKVLIFSSYVKHLKIIETLCHQNKWEYSLLTGQTPNREKVIDKFQKNNTTHLFLISLKAGGVGLNLTAADYVMILDPWWNPAAEMQAINRAHRIGQTQNVIVYKYITRKTIEEKIRILQNKKQQLSNNLINDNIALKGLNNKEIEELFK